MQPRDLDPHLHAQLGVEVRQRLVEQEDLRLAHDGAADRDALALAAGELAAAGGRISGVDLQDLAGALATRRAVSALSLPFIRSPKDRFSSTVMCG